MPVTAIVFRPIEEPGSGVMIFVTPHGLRTTRPGVLAILIPYPIRPIDRKPQTELDHEDLVFTQAPESVFEPFDFSNPRRAEQHA